MKNKLHIKHALSLVLCICLTLSLAACSDNTLTQSSSSLGATSYITDSNGNEIELTNSESIELIAQKTNSRAMENFKIHLTTLTEEQAKLILNDPELLYTMLMDVYWFSPQKQRFSGEKANMNFGTISILDSEGADITGDIVDLWYAANEVYNVDDMYMFEMGESILLPGFGIEYYELKNYDDVVDGIFTANAKEQLEEKAMGNSQTFIHKADNKAYRMGPWKTGHSLAYSLADIQVKEMAEGEMTLTAKYDKFNKPTDDPAMLEDYKPDYAFVDFTVALTDGVWYVQDYNYPE